MAVRDATPLVVGVGLVLVAGALTFVHFQSTAGTEPVDAVVVESGVVQDTVAVQYRYTVDGETYTSRNVCPGGPLAGCVENAHAFVEQHPAGTDVTAHVDPDDPSRSYLLEPKFPPGYLALAGFGVLFTLFGFLGSEDSE